MVIKESKVIRNEVAFRGEIKIVEISLDLANLIPLILMHLACHHSCHFIFSSMLFHFPEVKFRSLEALHE